MVGERELVPRPPASRHNRVPDRRDTRTELKRKTAHSAHANIIVDRQSRLILQSKNCLISTCTEDVD